MPPIVLLALKIAFLALLYVFVYRAIRSVAADVRAAGPVPRPAGRHSAVPPTPRDGRAVRRRGKSPRKVVVLDEHGAKSGTYTLESVLQVGRADACQIRLTDTYISQFHARIFPRDSSWFVEDLGSTNGTFLNQRKLTAPSELRPGDRLRLGRTILELRA